MHDDGIYPVRLHVVKQPAQRGWFQIPARESAWFKDDSLDKLGDLPPPDVLQQEIIEHLEAA